MSTPPVAVCWVSALTARASPKSATFTRPSSASRTFSGFTSRWIMPAWWAAASAESTGSTSASAFAGAIGASLRIRSRSVWPGMYSIARNSVPSSSPWSKTADDVLVREPRRGPGLAHEAAREVVVVAEPGVHDLERADAGRAAGRWPRRRWPSRRGRCGDRRGSDRRDAPDHRVSDSPVHDALDLPSAPGRGRDPAHRSILGGGRRGCPVPAGRSAWRQAGFQPRRSEPAGSPSRCGHTAAWSGYIPRCWIEPSPW